MTDTNQFLESVRQFFSDLYAKVQEGRVSYHDALGQVPLPVFYLTAGTPGRIGSAMEQHALTVTHDPTAPMREVRSLTWSVMSLVEHFRGNEDYNRARETREAIEFQWTMLRSYIFNAVAPGRTQYWLTSLVQQPELEQAVIYALLEGAAIYNGQLDQTTWQHDHWEASVSTNQIIEWFQVACEEARKGIATAQWQRGE